MGKSSVQSTRCRYVKPQKHNLLFSYLDNPFPLSQDDYMGTNWFYWTGRIEEGQRREVEYINKMTKDIPDDIVSEYYAEDYGIALDITKSMYAALSVSVWSSVEKFVNVAMWCIELKKGIVHTRAAFTVGNAVDFFSKSAGIKFEELNKSEVANAMRILANSFKHNDGRYRPDGFPMSPSLATRLEIEAGGFIQYENLPFAELIVGCGLFCSDLRSKTRIVIEH